MNPLFEQAEEWLKAGQRADKLGMYYLAGIRYSQVWATLFNIITLRDSGSIAMDANDEAHLASLYQRLGMRLQILPGKMKNGQKPKLSGPSKDTPLSAVEVLLEEVMAGF